MNTGDNNFKKSYKILFWTGIGVALIIFAALLLDYFKIISLQNILYNFQLNPNSSTGTKLGSSNPDRIIVRVGMENIFRKDFDIEMADYPKIKDQDAEKIILQKLIKDSILLQAARSERWISIDKSVFNSPEKDYFKRLRLVRDVYSIYENRQNIVAGKVISLWFHNMVPAEIGYEQGKQVAFNKISILHSGVKSGRINMLQAAQSIIEDKDLAKIDKSYESNAILSFRAKENEVITFDKNFNSVIRGLKAGEISDVFLAKDLDNNDNLIDAVYMFAQVDEITADGTGQDFDDWYDAKAGDYEIQYF